MEHHSAEATPLGPLGHEQWARAPACQSDRARDKGRGERGIVKGQGDMYLRRYGNADCGPEFRGPEVCESGPRCQSQERDTSIPELIQHFAKAPFSFAS